jgi:hypothetical protein
VKAGRATFDHGGARSHALFELSDPFPENNNFRVGF